MRFGEKGEMRMKRKMIMGIAILIGVCGMFGCQKQGSAVELPLKGGSSAIVEVGVGRSGEEVIVEGMSKVYRFNEETKRLLPICTEIGCEHNPLNNREKECPAAILAALGDSFVPYEGKLWFVMEDYDSAGPVLEIYAADCSGKNVELICKAGRFEQGSMLSSFNTSYYYDGKLYLQEANLASPLDETFQARLIEVDLGTGKVEVQVDWVNEERANFYVLGIYDGALYYEYTSGDQPTKANGLYRVDLETGEELLLLQKYASAQMDGKWIAILDKVGENDELNGSRILLLDLETGERKIIKEYAVNSLGMHVSNGKILWYICDGVEDSLFRPAVYTIETDTLEEGEQREFDALCCACLEDGFLMGNGSDYYYVSEKDFLAGEEMTMIVQGPWEVNAK